MLKKTYNLRKMYNFRYILHLPFRLQILWIQCLIFAGPKRNSGKPKVRRFDFGIVTVMIWTLSWQIEGKTFHAMHQAVHSSNKFSHFIFSTKIIVTFIHSSLRVVRIAPPSRFAPPKLDCFKDGSRQIGTRQIGPLVSNPANWAPHFRGPNLPFPWKIGPRQIAAPTFSRGPIYRSPICQGPICRGLICRCPICQGPIYQQKSPGAQFGWKLQRYLPQYLEI